MDSLSKSQLRLMLRITEAFRLGGPPACTARELFSLPHGRDYANLRALYDGGCLDQVPLGLGRNASIAWIPAQRPAVGSLSELL
jgi:hypothetical protein